MHFPITRGLRPLVIWGNASTRAEKKLNTRIASCGKATFATINQIQRHSLPLHCGGIFLIQIEPEDIDIQFLFGIQNLGIKKNTQCPCEILN